MIIQVTLEMMSLIRCEVPQKRSIYHYSSQLDCTKNPFFVLKKSKHHHNAPFIWYWHTSPNGMNHKAYTETEKVQ